MVILHIRIGASCRSVYMSWLELKGAGNEVKGRLKQWIGRIIGDDLVCEEGKDDEWLGRMQKRLSQSRARRLQIQQHQC